MIYFSYNGTLLYQRVWRATSRLAGRRPIERREHAVVGFVTSIYRFEELHATEYFLRGFPAIGTYQGSHLSVRHRESCRQSPYSRLYHRDQTFYYYIVT